MSTTIDSLQIQIQTSSTNAATGIRDLAVALGELKKNGAFGTVTKNLKSLADALNAFTPVASNASKINSIATSLEKLKSVGSITDVTLEQIESVFAQLSLDKYFNMYIKEPLLLITHDKKEDYPTYIAKLLASPVASIVKFMDMADNMNTTGLVQLGDFELARIEKYAHFSKVINDKWHFLERCRKYKQLYNRQQ